MKLSCRCILRLSAQAARRAGVVLLLCAVCGLETAYCAQELSEGPEGEFALEVWTTERGLPQNSITALLQTRSGYIWAATYNGIAQFDGERFTVFDSSNTKGLPNSRITSLFEDAQGDIWIGHDTGEVTRYSDGVFHPEPFHPTWNSGTINGIGSDVRGDIWALNLRGEAVRIRDGRLIRPPPELAADPSVMPQLVTDQQHKLIMVRNGGVAEITPSGSRKIEFQSLSSPPYYSRITTARKGGWWVAGDDRVRRWENGSWQEDLGQFPWGDSFVMTMMEASSGQVLVGTLERGLFIYDAVLGWMNLARTNGLPQDWIRCLAEDSEHNIWVGTSGGLAVLRSRKIVMHNPPDGWQGRPVLAITRAQDGAVWAATEGAGLYREEGNTWTHFDASTGLSNVFVWSVIQDSLGNIWAGTWGGGLFRLEGDHFVREFDLLERGEPVTALLEYPAGTIWFGTPYGLIRLTNGKLERLSAMGGAAAGDVRSLEPGRDGEVWIGTQGAGLGRFRDGELETFTHAEGLPRDFILSSYQDVDKTLWIGTQDRGLIRYRQGRFDSLSTDQGLPNNVIGHIEDDNMGNLWFNSQQGLFRVSKNDLNACADGKLASLPVLVFGKAEGLATAAGSSGFAPSGFRAPDGKLWFPTARGIAVVNPKAVQPNEVPPSVWIEEVFIEGRRAKIKMIPPPSSPGRKPAPQMSSMRSIEFLPGQRQLEVSFTGISLTSPERVRFKYRLEGLDTDWTDGGAQRRVTYPFLPPGRYTFRVIACNSDGLWNETGDAMRIEVLPYVWQTWWFKTSLVLAGLAAVGAGVYLESRRRHRHKLERISRERALERERARIAQDIHDDLGASLTRIGLLSESAAGDLDHPKRTEANLEQILSTTRDLTRSMDEIVWAVNPRHDTLESLTNYISNFAHDFLSTAHIRCRLRMPIQLPDISVRSEVRHNLFLACKEALHNVVKHSKASEVRLTLEFVPGGLRFAIADNGPGFDPRNPADLTGRNRLAMGNGLPNLQTRLMQIGGQSTIKSAPGEGTTVEFFVPLANANTSVSSKPAKL